MKDIIRKTRSFPILAVFFSMLMLGACGYEKNETDIENEIEAAENEIGSPTLKNEDLTNEGAAYDSIYDGEQPARIDGQEGHPAPATEEEYEYEEYEEDVNQRPKK